ncbi:MAG: hypothetical protein IJW49_10775 [Clostridia bacterium]|nr:hypothetical protein [Clostridia bacterium]
MKNRQIINIINFIRGVEPRREMDLCEPVREQIKLIDQNGLKGTFLLQYDALIDPKFVSMLKELDQDRYEIGVWFEVVEPLTKKAGIEWTGRFPWDWHAHCGFSVGYTKPEREKLISILFEDFKSIMGYYPRVFGSWAFDAHTLRYIDEHYEIDAACNCRDQWGTDGYNMWGGYYGQGYYPSKNNMICPAATEQNQISFPVFRMLGSDMIQQYDLGLDVNVGVGVQKVSTLEPYYTNKERGGGGIPAWVDWYFNENYSGNCLSFGYAQAGQENSFGWDGMKDGLEYQFAKIAEWQKDGRLESTTLGETGRAYRAAYRTTPASALVASKDWKGNERPTVWYCSKYYRINLYAENKRLWIRDLHLFREDYVERYETETAKGNLLTFDNLPVADGVRFSGEGIRAGLYPMTGETWGLPYESFAWRELEEPNACTVTLTGTPHGTVVFTLREAEITVECEKGELVLVPKYASVAKNLVTHTAADPASGRLTLRYNNFDYGLTVTEGKLFEDLHVETQNRVLNVKTNL